MLSGLGFVVLGALAWVCLYSSLRFISPMKYVCDVVAVLCLYAMTRLLKLMIATVKDVWRNPIQ
jgi:hypothetical protein